MIIVCLLLLAPQLPAQTLPAPKDFTPDPDRALLTALILPGSGQIYNREAWKAPIVWGMFMILGFYADEQHRQYSYTTQALHYLRDSNPETTNPLPRLSSSNLEQRSEGFRRERDYAFILISITYILQAIEAHVSAHLLDFDDDEALSYRSRLFYEPTPLGMIFNLSLSISLRS